MDSLFHFQRELRVSIIGAILFFVLLPLICIGLYFPDITILLSLIVVLLVAFFLLKETCPIIKSIESELQNMDLQQSLEKKLLIINRHFHNQMFAARFLLPILIIASFVFIYKSQIGRLPNSALELIMIVVIITINIVLSVTIAKQKRAALTKELQQCLQDLDENRVTEIRKYAKLTTSHWALITSILGLLMFLFFYLLNR